MKGLLTLLYREWIEWRTTLIIVLAIFMIGLIALGYGSYRFSNALEHGSITFRQSESGTSWSIKDQPGADRLRMTQEALKDKIVQRPAEAIATFGHLLRGGLSSVNFLLLFLIVFYLADATYKERADGSTYYYRSLPVTDWDILISKLLFGFTGILALSFILGVILVYYLHLIVPGVVKSTLVAQGYSLGQISLTNLFFGWAEFLCVEFLWLLPFAVYFLLISTVVKNRPLLISIGVLLLIGLAWKLSFGVYDIQNPLLSNISIMNGVLKSQWMNISGISAGEPADLFGSFTGFIFSIRTLISLTVAAGFFWGTGFVYRRNIEVS